MRIGKRIGLLGLALGLALVGGAARAENEAAAATITGSEIKSHITFLASDALEGRDTGSAGERTAGDYIADAFRRYGLEPAGEDGGYFQRFDVAAGTHPSATSRLTIVREGFSRDFAFGEDAVPFGFSAQGTVDAPLVFAGYGITDPEHGRDDYAGLDVKGKAVLVLRHEPGLAVGRSRLAHFVTKAENAKKHGAVALLVVTGPLFHPADDDLVPAAPGQDAGILAFHVRQALVKGLFKLAGKDLLEVQKLAEQGPAALDLGASVRTTLQIEQESLHARNVIGRLPGTDLASEVVVVGAHYDHVGHGEFGSLGGERGAIHNGADDNASGTSGMLELAQAFTQGGVRPRRTILFMGFSGEERGLLGSEHYVKHPTVPLTSIVAMINLDMIGRLRNDTLEVGGIGTAAGFKGLVEGALATEGLRGTLTASGIGPSDHASFCQGRVPVLFFFTGEHEDYHRPTDDVEKIEANGAARVGRAAFRCAEQLASAAERPVFVEVPEARGAGRGDPNRPRLGVMLDRERTEGGAGIQSVVADGPAAKAGIQDGDVIVQLGEVAVDGPRDLMEALGAHKLGDKVKVTVLRGAERVTVEVELKN